jgi:hypothetical protein
LATELTARFSSLPVLVSRIKAPNGTGRSVAIVPAVKRTTSAIRAASSAFGAGFACYIASHVEMGHDTSVIAEEENYCSINF